MAGDEEEEVSIEDGHYDPRGDVWPPSIDAPNIVGRNARVRAANRAISEHAADDELIEKAKAKAVSLADEAINVLVDVMTDTTLAASTRIAAANSILDRGMGKPKQSIETTGNQELTINHLIRGIMRDDKTLSLADTRSEYPELPDVIDADIIDADDEVPV